MADGRDLRVGVVGYGLAGRVFHAPLVQAAPGMAVAAVVTRDPERAAQARSDLPGVEIVADPAELLGVGGREPVDLLVVASTNDSHVPVGLAAVAAGVPVVVDKPVAPSSAQAQRLVDAAAAAGVALSVFQNRRWDSDQLTLRRLLAGGELGEVLRYESRFERWRPEPKAGSWREALPFDEGGGLLLDLGSHLVDQAVGRFGPVQRVFAQQSSHRTVADDDVFVVLEHASGVTSHLSATALAGSPGPRLRVLGTAGAFVVDGLDGQEDALRGGWRPDGSGFAEPRERWGRLVRGEQSVEVPAEPGRWEAYYPAMAAAVRGEGPVPVDPREAVEVLRVLEAARRSALEHRVVELATSRGPAA